MNGIMDYSLLFAVETLEVQSNRHKQSFTKRQFIQTMKNKLSIQSRESSGHSKQSNQRGTRVARSTVKLADYTYNDLLTQVEICDNYSSKNYKPKISRNASSVSLPSLNQITSSCGKYIYHVAIIDYLQQYNMYKQFEHHGKSCLMRTPCYGEHEYGPDDISAIQETKYKDRFNNFMRKQVLRNTY